MSTPQTMGAKIIIEIVTLVVILVILVAGFMYVRNLQEKVASLDDWKTQAETRLGDTEKITAKYDGIMQDRAEFHITVDDKRKASDKKFTEVLNDNQVARDWGHARIPDVVRGSDQEAAATQIDGPPNPASSR